MQEVDAMALEPFELHTAEHFTDHSPSEYLSTKFYLPIDNSAKHIAEKEDAGVDALWTKAVDNMFKSSRLFNSDVKEEEKENVHENLLENASKEVYLEDFHLGEEDQALKEGDKFIEECELNGMGEGDILCEAKHSKVFGTSGDQIVPTAKGFSQHSTPKKRRNSDLDVNFGALPTLSMKPDLKKVKLNPETGREVIEDEGAVGDYEPPRNSVFVDYCFDPKARLPSFREAFVPALKRISRREKELRRKLKESDSFMESEYTLAGSKNICNATPVQGQIKRESGDPPSRDATGASLERGSDHPNAVLSELNEVSHFETISKREMNLLSGETVGGSEIGEIPRIDDKIPNNELKLHIKQEEMMDCDRHGNNELNNSPGKLLGISSANLKDIEKNIFTFDEGLDILDLEREFPLQSINTGHAEASSAAHGHSEANWSVNLSHVTNVHQTPSEGIVSQREGEVNAFMDNRNAPNVNATEEQYLSVNGRQIPISSLGGSFAVTPVSSYSIPLHSNGDDINLAQFENSHQTGEVVKYGNGLKRFDLLGQADGHQQHELNSLHINGYDVVNRDKRLIDVQIAQNHMNHFTHDVNMMKQPVPGMHGNTGIEGQMIARQIHQSFGADVFGAPGDDGAKILAKYLAQRGSTRPDTEEQRGSMTSAISSLISKSFSQQEANQRLQRESGSLDFLHAADFDNLDIMNENF